MSRLFYNVMQDNAGNLLFDVTGTMRHAGTGTLATIYGDEARTVILPNPMTNHPNFGSFKCFLAPGDYDFYMAKAGYTFETLTGVQGLGSMAQQDAHAVAITGGTAVVTALQVAGNARIDNQLGVGEPPQPAYTVLVAALGDSLFRGKLGVGGGTPTDTLTVTGTSSVSARMGIGEVSQPGYQLVVAAADSLFRGKLGVGGGAPTDTLTVTGTATVSTRMGIGEVSQPGYQLVVAAADSLFRGKLGVGGGAPVETLTVTGSSSITGTMKVGGDVAFGSNFSPSSQARIHTEFAKATKAGVSFRPVDSDTGPNATILFMNTANGTAGSISQTASAVAYNTSSDARLKHDVATLTGELPLIQALRPVSFRWNADGSRGVGFLAHEVAAQVQGVITGDADALDADGGILPQQIDYSKLVPWLVGAVQTLAARVAVLEDALGV